MVRITLSIEGMACGMCEAHINEAVRNAFKVKKVSSSHHKIYAAYGCSLGGSFVGLLVQLMAAAIQAGRCEVLQADVSRMNLPENQYDLVTAFETVYF